ncbi:MAG: peptidase M3 [Planctomycetota bacterium]|nr:MAG: peptidase M3 [Planctomycetota bacterium]
MRICSLAALTLAVALCNACSMPFSGSSEEAPWLLADTPLNRDAATLSADTDAHIASARELRDRIVAIDGEHTVENTLELYNELEMHLGAAGNDCQLLEAVHTQADVREAAQEGARRVSEYGTELGLDRELYAALLALDTTEEDESTRWAHSKILREYRRSGVDKDEATRSAIRQLDADLVLIGQAFDENIRNAVLEVETTVAGLAGLPDDFLASHPAADDGTVTVNTTYPDYQPIMRYATDLDLRRRLFMQYKNRAYPENLSVLSDLLVGRERYAKLLGYPDWVAYRTEPLMIGSGEAADAFIEKVAALARPVSQRDMARLLERKRRDHPSATDVEEFEGGLYGNLVRKEGFDFDSQALRPYLEFERVREGIFDLSARLFELRFEPAPGLELWHESVTAWNVYDDQGQLGRFYLDLFPRESKYGHAACFPYRIGVGEERLPQAVLVCNFPDPAKAPNGVALMEFGQVSTFFHEFGHLLHMMLSGRQHWMQNSGFGVEWDFVEAPSQMLEEFLLEPEVLQSFAVHHETGEVVPSDLIEKLRRSSEFGKGSGTMRQMYYAAVSLHSHLADPTDLDTTRLSSALAHEFSPYDPVPDTHMQCSFGHLSGYSCIYYTYMWSKVMAKDMYSRFSEEGVLNPAVARAYRDAVLAPGGSKPAGELVADFLGRERSFDAFREWLKRK